MESVILKELVDIYLGVTHTPTYVDEGIPFLSVKDISDGKIDFSNCKYITADEYKTLSKGAKPQIGDMLFCRVGTIGKPIIIPEGTPQFGSFVSLGYLRNKDSKICNLNYLRHWMNSQGFNKQIMKNVKGASQVNLNTGWLSKFEVPLPNMSKQKYVVEVLDNCQRQIQLQEQKLQWLDELIKSRFVEMFGDVITNNKSWRKYTWNEVLTIVNGRNQKAVEDENGQYLICGSGGPMGRANDFLVNENSVIIGRKGNINKPILMREKFWNVDTAFGLEPNEDTLTAEYLYYFCDFYDFEQLNKAVTIPSLTKADLLKIEMPIPNYDLQEQFVTFVNHIDKLKVKAQQSIDETQTLFDSLMQKYFK